jgi:peptidoglycan/xylan/chitin deacetylase (PgdA/CDA1 family)
MTGSEDIGAAHGGALILMYHRVTTVPSDPFSLCVTPEHFAEQLEVVREHTQPMRLQHLAEGLQQDAVPPRAVVLTFDDGYADNLLNARPLLDRYDIPATVFITTGNLRREREFWWDELERILLQPGTLPKSLRLTIGGTGHAWDLDEASTYDEDAFQRNRQWRFEEEAPTRRHSLYCSLWRLLQLAPDAERRATLDELVSWSGGSGQSRPNYRTLTVQELLSLGRGDLVEIGAHTVTHPALPELSENLQREEVSQSKLELEEMLGYRITSFAYPYGSLSKRSVAIVRECGFDRACSTASMTVEPNSDRFQLPRIQVDDWNGEEFHRRLGQWFGRSTAHSVPHTSGCYGQMTLRVAEPNLARLVFSHDDLDEVRIAIEKDATEQPFDIQLNQPGLKINANQRYCVGFRARADDPRRMFVGIAQDYAPWDGLGLYHRIDLNPEWETFRIEFVAVTDESEARIHFDLGGSSISVELSSVGLCRLQYPNSGEE